MVNASRFVVFGLLLSLGACGSSSPDNFIETSTRISCKKMKKCDDAQWNEAGFSSVSDCTDQILDGPAIMQESSNGEGEEDDGLGGLESLFSYREAFVLACTDFDKKAARQCLSGMRKVKRKCDDGAMSSEQEDACASVCGDPVVSELFVHPEDRELLEFVIEELE